MKLLFSHYSTICLSSIHLVIHPTIYLSIVELLSIGYPSIIQPLQLSIDHHSTIVHTSSLNNPFIIHPSIHPYVYSSICLSYHHHHHHQYHHHHIIIIIIYIIIIDIIIGIIIAIIIIGININPVRILKDNADISSR